MKLTRSAPIGIIVCTLAAPLAAFAAPEPLYEPSLEDLTKAEISSVSRRPQSLADTPAAAYVISAEDIRRSGAQTLPDVLRMAPGIEVAQIDNGRYAVTARGFNGRFANKLQVLIDGRSIYSPFFSGTMWEHEPVALEDIERIEILRGPGAAMWGANAVNGTINIVTRHAAAQEGTLITPTVGKRTGQLYARYGQRVDDSTNWKLSVHGRHSAPSTRYATGQSSADRYENAVLDLRVDRNLGSGSALTLWVKVARMSLGDYAMLDPEPLPVPHLAYARLEQTDESDTVAGRYRWLSGPVESTLQLSVTRTRIEVKGWFREDRQTIDLDYQGRRAYGAHDLLWGLSHRSNHDEALTHSPILSFIHPQFTQRSTGLFLHDDWSLVPERWKLGLGARWEHSNLGGATWAPSATLMWTPTPTQTFWGKLARAPRVPARAEQHLNAIPAVQPLPVAPYLVLVRTRPGAEGLAPETMSSLELGYRAQLAHNLNIDLTAYRQRYKDRVSGRNEGLTFVGIPPYTFLVQDIALCNCSNGWIHGVELAADWLPTPTWRLQLSFTTTRLDLDGAATPEAAQDNRERERRTPRRYGSLRSQWNPTPRHQLDLWLRGAAGFDQPNAPYPELVRVPGYLTLDVRFAYRLNRQLELFGVGRNLIGARRYEYIADHVPSAPIEIKPALFLGLRLAY